MSAAKRTGGQAVMVAEQLENRQLFSAAYALVGTAGTVLVKFNTDTPGTIDSSKSISGLGRSEKLAGIDFRPATGQLFALSIKSTSGNSEGRIYTIDPSTGAATQVGSSPFSTGLVPDASYGFDFNPAVDRIRIFNDADQNLRVNPDSGALAATDTNLDDPTNDEEVSGGAYDRNISRIFGSSATTLFGIDFINDSLVRIGGVDGTGPEGSPNLGVVTQIGPLGITTATSSNGFDIGQDGAAYAVLTDANDDNSSGLYTIDLTTGEATLVGDLNNAAEITRGFTIVPDNFPPTANPDTYQVASGTPLVVSAANGVLKNDTDPEGDSLTSTSVVGTSHGSIFLNADGSFTYAPDAGFVGVDTFNYVADDGTSASLFTTVTFNVVPLISIDDKAITEGNSGTKVLTFTATLSAPAGADGVSVMYETKNNTAGSGDYNAASGTLIFATGELSRTFNVTIKGDTKSESDETFFVKLKNPSGAAFGDDTGVGTILNDDAVPAAQPKVFIDVNNESIFEGNSGTRLITFKVWLDKASTSQVKVNYGTQNGTAGSGDYNAKSGVVTFNAGETQKTVSITIKGDTKKEADETFFVNLTNAINAAIGKGQGIGTIKNDD